MTRYSTRIMHGKKEYKCDICQNWTSTGVINYSTNADVFRCDKCKSFSSSRIEEKELELTVWDIKVIEKILLLYDIIRNSFYITLEKGHGAQKVEMADFIELRNKIVKFVESLSKEEVS